ncbi:MAG: START domain-containing protein [Bacteriovoracaceae bacterium]|jgi:hypothetical protein|nr:hypothetical protein [Halobacteriovoraceae bacterium]MDP7320990.1 START domain-containing protein [Bacteriovoracaceae bacterium]
MKRSLTIILFFLISFSCFAKEENWVHLTRKNDIDVYSKKVKTSPIKFLRAQGIIQSSIENIVAILRNVENAVNWVPNLGERSYVKNISDTEAILYDISKMPWPVTDRDMVVHHKLSLSPDKKSLILSFHSVENELKPIQEGFVRAKIHRGKIIFTPKTKNTTYVSLTILVDPMGDIPKWVVNLLQVKLPYEFLMSLNKFAAKTSFKPVTGIQELLDQLIR